MPRTANRLLITGLLLIASNLPAADEVSVASQIETRAAEAAAALGSQLKQRLVSTMQADGPVAAIDVCAVEAPKIAAEISARYELDVGRASLKSRNPAKAPDRQEMAVLVAWKAAVTSGTPSAELPVHVERGENFLWMQPITVAGPCLACHGKQLAAPVAEALAARYPDDRATGYKAGDLRGAFVVKAIDSDE